MMVFLYVVACLADSPRDCKTIDYQAFETKQACNQAYIPAMLAFAQQFPRYTIKLMAGGKDEMEL